MQNTDLYYLTYDTKFGLQSVIFTDYNEAIEFLNDHAENYIGTTFVSADRKQSSFYDMTEYLEAYLGEQSAWQKHIGGSLKSFDRV